MTKRLRLLLLPCLLSAILYPPQSLADYVIKKEVEKNPRRQADIPWTDNRTHRMGNIWLTVNNWGWLGNFNDYDTDAYRDAEVDDWAPQCEVPGGSSVQYLFAAGLWIGGLIVDENGNATPRVSTGADGYVAGEAHEFYPGEGSGNVIKERTTRQNSTNRLGNYISHENAISEQDFITAYTDTLVDNQFTPPVDGVPHEPLGIRVTQKSYSWSYNYARDLIVIDYEIENIASKFLRNLYVGLYVDADVGRRGYSEKNLDDIAGFADTAWDSLLQQEIPINTAWIADNDGRDADIDQGNSFTCPHVTGFRVLRSPNPKLETSFNWWTSSSNQNQDFGPSWESWLEQEEGSWTQFRGTPMNDDEKYFILSNGEFDYNQWHVDDAGWVSGNPQIVYNADSTIARSEDWQTPGGDTEDVANGYDTRYLVSWGPMGVFDHEDRTGRWIYRLNPGEKFSFTVALVAGRDFHDRNRPQAEGGALDPSLYNFNSLENTSLWAARIYDNELYDTPIFDFGNDGIPNTNDADGSEGDGLLDTGDGWYGEDAGSDGLYAELPPGQDSVQVWYFGHEMGWYTGPDEDGSENNGRLDPGEDELLWNLANFAADSGYVYAGPRFSQGGHSWIPVYGGGRERASFGSGGDPDWFIGHLNLNGLLDRGDGIPDFQGPPPPPPPALSYATDESNIYLRWRDNAEGYVDPFSRIRDFEGYRIWVGNENFEDSYSLLGEYDRVNFAYYDRLGRLRTPPDDRGYLEAPIDTTIEGWLRQPVGSNNDLRALINPRGWTEPFEDLNEDKLRNTEESYQDQNGNGVWDSGEPFIDSNADGAWTAGEPWEDENGNGRFDVADDYTVYEFVVPHAGALYPRWYAVTSFDFGDYLTGTESLESSKTANATAIAPSGLPTQPVRAVPNPYRFDQDYTRSFAHSDVSQNGLSWENQDDGTARFYPSTDRRLDFVNLPEQALIRIYTLSGDLVQIVPHNVDGDNDRNWSSPYSESWDLNNRNFQMVGSGLYYFSVEDQTPAGKGNIQTGKFVILK